MNILVVVTSADTLRGERRAGVDLETFALPFIALCEVGMGSTVASPQGGAAPIDPVSGPDDRARGQWRAALQALTATVPLGDVAASDFEGLYLPGGRGAMVDLAGSGLLAGLVEEFDRAGKPIAALGHGTAGLLRARSGDRSFLEGRKVTGFTNAEEKAAGLADAAAFLLETRLREAGALFEHALLPGGSHVVRDGVLITGQNPVSSEALARALAETLAERQRARLAAADTAT